MKVYAVANLKGGVGKTTTTVNVAYTFSEMGGRVLVIHQSTEIIFRGSDR